MLDALNNYIVDVSVPTLLTPDNAFRMFRVNATGGDVTFYAQSDADATIGNGTKWDFSLDSATNAIKIVAGAGASVRSAEGANPDVTTQYAGATVVKMAANTYQVFGRVSAS